MRPSLKSRRRLLVESLESRTLMASDVVTSLFASSSFDIFMKLDQIAGDSQDADHAGSIEVESFSWGASNSGTFARPTATATDLHVLSRTGKATPKLLESVATGKHIAKVELLMRPTGPKTSDFYKVVLEDVLVSSLRTQSLNEEAPEEEITLSFAKISESYRETSPDGAPSDWTTASWNVDPRTRRAPGASLLDSKVDLDGEAAVDVFLKLDGVPGESKDNVHKGEIEILSYSWGMSQTGGYAGSGGRAGSGGGLGSLTVQDFHFVLPTSIESPVLAEYVATGKHIPTATISVRRSPGATDFIKYQLKDVIVSSYRQQGTNEDSPLDEISLNFTNVEQTFVDDSPTTDQAPAPVQGTWSNARRRATYKLGDAIIDDTEPPQAPTDYFLKFDGIEGESKDKDHKGAVDLESFSWGMSRPSTSRTAAGGAAANTFTIEDFHMVSPVDATSPVLFRNLATGKHIAKAVLFVRKQGESQQDYIKFEMADVLVTSLHEQSVNDSEPLEEVSLYFAGARSAVSAPDDQGSSETSSTSMNRVNGRTLARYSPGPSILDLTDARPASAAAFIKFDGVDGDSAASDHKGEIDVLSYSWGVSRSDFSSTGQGNSAGRTKPHIKFEPLSVVTAIDSTTPVFFDSLARGKHFSKAVLTVARESEGRWRDYHKLGAGDVLLSEFRLEGADGETPLEQLALTFTSFADAYLPEASDGQAAEPIAGTFDSGRSTVRFDAPASSLLDLTKAPRSDERSYIKFDGIEGESVDKDHAGWTDGLRWSFGASNPTPVRASGGGGGAGKVQMQDFHFVKVVDSTSPDLFESVVQGKHFPTVQLALQRGGDTRHDFLKFELSDAVGAALVQQGEEGSAPIEEMSLTFQKIEMRALDQEDGAAATWTRSRARSTSVPGPAIIDKVEAPSAATMAFIKFDGVDGESKVKGHESAFQIDSFSWGVTNSGTRAYGSGGGAGKVSFQDLHFTTSISKASPQLFLATVGVKQQKAVLDVDRVNGDGATSNIYSVEMSNVFVSSYDVSGSTSRGGRNDIGLRVGKIDSIRVPHDWGALAARDEWFSELAD